jgi:hypothetical protein
MTAPLDHEGVAQVGRLAGCGHELPDVTIVVGDFRLPAHSYLLRFHSSCASGRPAPFTEWDLTNLRIGDEGQPPSEQTVLAWLEWLYGSSTKSHSPSTIVDALPLLQFADAVGTTTAVLEAMAKSYKWAVTVSAKTGDAPCVELMINKKTYFFSYGSNNTEVVLNYEDTIAPTVPTTVRSMSDGRSYYSRYSAEDLHALQKTVGGQAAAQVEQVLYVVLKVHLTELADELVDWVYIHMRKYWAGSSSGSPHLFDGGLYKRIFSTRVMIALGEDHLKAVLLKFVHAE